ncbi:MAG: polysaccharide pyruvyl transferase family protein [Limisphaerales bacterium]
MPCHSNDPIPINFGDDLFGKVAGKITGQEITACSPNYSGRKIFIGGSTLGYARNGDEVWGAGVRDGSLRPGIHFLKVHAVRGPKSAAILRERGIAVPYLYGDPALLWPELFPEISQPIAKWDYGIVPHFREFLHSNESSYPANARVISPMQDALTVLDEIRRCRVIIASSLHGIICAEAAGIPVEPYKLDDSHAEPDFKYADYYAATEREWKPHSSITTAVQGKFEKPPDYSVERKFLKESFPSNLKIDPTSGESIPPTAAVELKRASLPAPSADSSPMLKELEALENKLQTTKLAVQEKWRVEFARINPLKIEIRNRDGARLEKHILDVEAPWLRRPVPPCRIPGMITTEEKQYYGYLTQFYSGRGRVLELGPWLGCSTWHICAGLRLNPAFRNEKLHVVDDFVWRSSWMDGYYKEADRPAHYGDFRAIYERHVAEHANYLATRRARIAIYDGNDAVEQFAWDSGPIVMCFVDCGRPISANEAWYNLLRRHFICGKTLLILQDWQTHKEIPEKWNNQMKQFSESKGAALEQIHELRDGGVATFLYHGLPK